MANKDTSLLPPIQVFVGEVFTINLPDNSGSTGFIQSLTQLPDFVALISDEYKRSSNLPPGAPGERTFSFVAVKAGEGPLYFNGIKLSHPIEVAPRNVQESRFVIAKSR
jgi:predicted secreted protein